MTPPRARPARSASDPAARRGSDAAEVVNCLRRLFKALHEHSKAIQRRNGLSSPQVWALSILEQEPGLSLGELAERMYAHPSTVSGVVDRLEERRALRREVGRDRRSLKLSLTPRGRLLLRQSPSPVQAGLSRALAAMPAVRLRELRRSLEGIVRTSEVHGVEAPFFET